MGPFPRASDERRDQRPGPSGADLCAGHRPRGAGRGGGVHGAPELCGDRHRDGELRDRRRGRRLAGGIAGNGGRGLHRDLGYADVLGGPDAEDGVGAGPRRRDRRGIGALPAPVLERARRLREGGAWRDARTHIERRPVAEDVAVAVRAHGGEPGDRGGHGPSGRCGAGRARHRRGPAPGPRPGGRRAGAGGDGGGHRATVRRPQRCCARQYCARRSCGQQYCCTRQFCSAQRSCGRQFWPA